MVRCERSHCWRQLGEGHVMIRKLDDPYGHASRERDIEPRDYDKVRGGRRSSRHLICLFVRRARYSNI
jgi:hypothetical protein